MQLKQSLLFAIILSIVSMTAWELYWRSQGYEPNLNDDKHLWADQRAKVENLKEDGVLLIGSSRILFDIQLDEFEKGAGVRPIQLALPGASPLPVFHDIANNSAFTGTVIVGVTPGLFFSTLFPEASPWKRAQSKVDHYHSRTYAQRANHLLSLPLQQHLVFMSGDEELFYDDIDLKSLLRRIKIGARIPASVSLVNFSNTSVDRNTAMLEKTVTDTSFTRKVTNFWEFVVKKSPPPDVESTMAYFVKDAKVFMDRGGQLILLRCPASGPFKAGEAQFFPREATWDELLKQTNAKGYHYEDYDQIKNLQCPEWSHLSSSDAKYFTTEVTKILIADGLFIHPKTN